MSRSKIRSGSDDPMMLTPNSTSPGDRLETLGRRQVEDAKADVRVLPLEVADDRRQEVEGGCRQAGDGDEAGAALAGAAEREERAVELLEHPAHQRHQFLPMAVGATCRVVRSSSGA